VSTNRILSNGFNPVLPLPTTDQSSAFYRAVWLPGANSGSIQHGDDH